MRAWVVLSDSGDRIVGRFRLAFRGRDVAALGGLMFSQVPPPRQTRVLEHLSSVGELAFPQKYPGPIPLEQLSSSLPGPQRRGTGGTLILV